LRTEKVMLNSLPSQNTDQEQTGGPETLPAHTVVGEFEITGIIGEGGFGTVYLAIDHSLQRQVALKEYMPSALATRRGERSVVVRSQRHAETFDAGLRSFIHEARILAKFDHPALVKVYRFWQENNTAYMAMPYCKGQTLKQVIREHSQLITEAWLKALLSPLLDALEALHSAQIFHRDIAPDNVLILDGGAPMLLDFGAARHIIADLTQVTVILKPGYAPIEQYANDVALEQGAWTDIYALATMVYFAITRRAPPTSVTRIMQDPLLHWVETVDQRYSREFLTAIDAGLAIRPEARPQSIAEFRERLGLESAAPARPASVNPAALAPIATSASAPPAGDYFDIPPIQNVALPPTEHSQPAQQKVEIDIVSVSAAQLPQTKVSTTQPELRPKERHGWKLATVALVVAALVVGGFALISTLRLRQAPSVAKPAAQRESPASAALVQAPPLVIPQPALPPVAVAEPVPADNADAVVTPVTAKRAVAQLNDAAPAPSGSVRLAVKPWGQVMVDGASVGVSPPLKHLSLSAGKHKVQVVNPGFVTYSTDIEVRKDDAVTLAYEFK
jgi:serine/threonine protein kinase